MGKIDKDEKIKDLEHDIERIKQEKMWNYLSFFTGVLFLMFVIYRDVQATNVSIGSGDNTFQMDSLYFLSILIMFGNRLMNGLTLWLSGRGKK